MEAEFALILEPPYGEPVNTSTNPKKLLDIPVDDQYPDAEIVQLTGTRSGKMVTLYHRDKGKWKENKALHKQLPGDPFGEPDPALQIVIDRWDKEGSDYFIVRGHVESMTVVVSSKAQIQGQYSSDEVAPYVRWVPDDFPMDIIVRKPLAEIMADDGDVGVLRYVYNRIASSLQMESMNLLMRHADRVITRDDADQGTGGVKLTGKAVDTTTKQQDNTETF